MKNHLFFVLAGLALLFFPGGCDMTYLDGPPGELVTEDDPGGELEDLRRNGSYLMLYRLPRETAKEHISAVRVTDGSRQVAAAEHYDAILIDTGVSFADAYIPLLAPNGSAFTRSGSFYVEVSVRIDALTGISIQAGHRVLVEFTEGRGILDLHKLVQELPGVVDRQDDPETEKQIDDIIASGGYIRFFNLARTVSPSMFSGVSVSNSSHVVARCPDYQAVAVRKNVLDAEAFVPLSASGDMPFTETGSYYTAFTIAVDALTEIRVDADLRALYAYLDGAAEIDVTAAPKAPDAPPSAPHSLTITGLPPTANPSNFVDVFVHNSQGVVATCQDLTNIAVAPFGAGAAAVIPLVYDNAGSFNGRQFSDSGDFIVTFSFFADAFYNIIVTSENNLVVSFDSGSGAVDASAIPPAPHNYLTVTNLPANLQELNVADVFVWNQAGKVGTCRDYGKLIITGYGSTTTLRIPLAYTAADQTFAETGSYYVSFDLNVDALTRILITQTEKILASFVNGNGTLDANNLPQAAPPPYLTIVGLPRNAAKNNFSDAYLYNAVGRIAKCANYQEILITKNAYNATAMLPLAYNDSNEPFRDSGNFIVTFTVNVDVSTRIAKTQADAFTAYFTDGSGIVDLSSDYGFFSGALANPSDGNPPVVKRGTVFEMNGAYFNVASDTSVKPAFLSLPKTSIVYLYAVSKPGGVEFEYSTTPPVWTAVKKGWYSGDRRALYKFVYLKDVVDQYAAKTFIGDPWGWFTTTAVTNPAVGNLAGQEVVSLSGASNPAQQTLTLSPGAYVFVLTGAGGGGGGGINGSSSYDYSGGAGGSGGFRAELVTVQNAASFTLFTGAGGSGAAYIPTGGSNGQYQGSGGGGGGSGTFAYSPDGYFAVAGGGGGGSGATVYGGGGGGGAGGSAGKGGDGGSGGDAVVYSSGSYRRGSAGGSGGGGTFTLNATHYGYAGSGGGFNQGSSPTNLPYYTKGADGGSAAYSVYDLPDSWKNTAGANGQGADGSKEIYGVAGAAGGPGGTNRTAARGGGAPGGSGGSPQDGPGSAGGNGGAGSIVIYKVL
jgi:hypothetical protein